MPSTVYPRPRGGTASPFYARQDHQGLSPPTRGNLPRDPYPKVSVRSIPAHAGEPLRPVPRRSRHAVYPRPRGGTSVDTASSFWVRALSPPTRGNLARRVADIERSRSIPAHAGEPWPTGTPRPKPTVYPRPRGGTTYSLVNNPPAGGLSPPTRGNHRAYLLKHKPAGSIPAHAGEPLFSSPRGRCPWVYPRPRGGTLTRSLCAQRGQGLSPPTRGNPHLYPKRSSYSRSIPAHAGEPCEPLPPGTAGAVYPRPRGGTSLPSFYQLAVTGLSPPTRGNLPAAVLAV